MRLYKCDRCGKYVKRDSLRLLTLPYRWLYRFGKKGHLCESCEKSFRDWFYEAKQKHGGEQEE